MRLPILLLFLIATAGLLGEILAASAQSAYSYPWCSKRPWGGAISCRYTSYEQCRQSGFGAICVRSPYYPAAPTTAPPVEEDFQPAHPCRHRLSHGQWYV
jgi:hypothetical protein